MSQLSNSLKKFSIITYGCTFNTSDSQKIEKILNENGLSRTNIAESDILFINTCSVKHATESKILSYVRETVKRYPNKCIIIGGCLPFIDESYKVLFESILKNNGFILHPREIGEIVNKIILYDNGKRENFSICYNPSKNKEDMYPVINQQNVIGIVPISEGCNNHCSYCCTKNARGSLSVYNHQSIISLVKHFLSHGIKEIHVTSQDLGNYDDNGLKLYDLLLNISEIPGKYFIRLGMLNPEYLIQNIEKFLKVFDDKRYFRFLHIPIQSASENILQKMRRNYDTIQIENIITKIRDYDPKFTFSTDIIVGFPTESQEDHQKSIEFIKKWKPHIVNISKFSSRPNTEAKLMPQLNSQIIKARSLEFTNLINEQKANLSNNWIDWEGEILINEYKKQSNLPYTGRNLYYLPILCKEGKIGDIVRVKITGFENQSLIGDIL